jgi:Rieske Fe-S protein
VKRRDLLKLGAGAGAAGIAAGLAGPIGGAALGTVNKTTVDAGEDFLDVAALDELEPGKPFRVLLRADTQDAWTVFRDVELGAAFVVRDDQDRVTAFSTVCPHLGCVVDLDEKEHVFTCPCHDSAFALDGERLTGPSTRGLYPLQARVEGGRVQVRFVRYG